MHEEFIIEPYTTAGFKSTMKIILNSVNKSNIILFSRDVEKMLQEVLSNFKCLEAAGGVVRNAEGELLLIYRRGNWDLPKGKIEKNETIEDAAIREVEEETGLKHVKIIRPVVFKKWSNKATYHSYFIGDTLAMKISYWFEMRAGESIRLVPQTDEDIEQAMWVPQQNLSHYKSNMYPSIADVLDAVY
jgi:8-oxo-dGTP pyrophosphatase MutT (NUDIX family)